MSWTKYKTEAVQLECDDLAYRKAVERLAEGRKMRILHAAMGVGGEAGELVDAIKKHIFYGRDLDVPHLVEEIGDIQWYLAVLLDELGVSMEEVHDKNIKKLRNRYGGQTFGSYSKLNVDRDKEREIMEEDHETNTGCGC